MEKKSRFSSKEILSERKSDRNFNSKEGRSETRMYVTRFVKYQRGGGGIREHDLVK